jgi:hydroxypyruvate isomerase
LGSAEFSLYVFRALDAAGYGGFVGLEYRPQADAAATLQTVRELL